jgi:hypothetical protein
VKRIVTIVVIIALSFSMISPVASAELRQSSRLIKVSPAYTADGKPYLRGSKKPKVVRKIQGSRNLKAVRTLKYAPQVKRTLPAANPGVMKIKSYRQTRSLKSSAVIKHYQASEPMAITSRVERMESIKLVAPVIGDVSRKKAKVGQGYNNSQESPARSESFEYTDINEAFKNVDKVQYLDLSGQSFSRLPRSIFSFTQLCSLKLADIGIENIPKGISQLQNLEHLDLSGNNLVSIPAEIFQLPNLSSLILADNLVDYIPNEIANLTYLQSLNFENNKIDEIPYAIDLLPNLSNVNFRGNPIPEWHVQELVQSRPGVRINY